MAIPAVNTSVPNAATTQSESARRSLGKDFNNFLKLLTTQLQNQDPTAPLDTNQMTQQIATLSQVEQQIDTNQNLEQLIALINGTQYNSVVSYIGKRIEAPGDVGALANGKAEYAYYLQDEAHHVDVTIKDSAGNVVYEGPGGIERGRNQFNWDGKSNTGQTMPDGIYKIELKALDANNNDVASQAFTTFVVNSVDSAGGNVYLSYKDIAVPLVNVTSIQAAI